MAQATQTRCAGCGQYVTRRADAFDAEFNDYAAEEAGYVSEYEEHECEADYSGYSMAPRDGEFEAWEAELAEDVEVVELEQVAAEVAPAPVATPVEAPAPTTTTDQEVEHGRVAEGRRGPGAGRPAPSRARRRPHRAGLRHPRRRAYQAVPASCHPRCRRGEVLGLRGDRQDARGGRGELKRDPGSTPNQGNAPGSRSVARWGKPRACYGAQSNPIRRGRGDPSQGPRPRGPLFAEDGRGPRLSYL